LAKHDLPEPSKNLGLTGIDKNSYLHFEELWKKVDPIFSKTIIKIPIKIKHTSNGNIDYNILITFFREGTLLLYIPAQVNLSNFLDFFIGRNEVISQIMQSKAPSECNLAVMVADLQNSMKISADLPPYEYFKLIKEILEIAENLTRKYHGTPGRHSGDGIIYFFVANAASTDSHTYNALICAEEIRREIQKINDNWKNRKNWTNKILLNFGLHEGKEWLGCIPAAGNMDSTVLGDTVNVTSRLAEFAKDGSIWVSKKFMRVIPQDSHKNIYYGIRHKTSQGEQWIPDIYSRIMDLIDLNELTNKKLMDIANMSVTEIREIEKNDSTSNSEIVTAKETTQALNFMPE
jgi:class 3 adenylate cyclase